MVFKNSNKYFLVGVFFLFSFFLYSAHPCLLNAEENLQGKLAKIPRIDCRKASTLFNAGKLFLIDTHEHLKLGDRSPIVGAITIPHNKLGKVKLKIPKNVLIACF